MTPILIYVKNRSVFYSKKERDSMKKRKIHPLFWIVLCCGAAFIALGILRDEVIVLYQKAVYICMECIGLG